MRIDFKCMPLPLPLLAVLVSACSGLADPDSRSAPPTTDGETTFALDDSADDENSANAGKHPEWPTPGQACEVAGQTFPDGSSVPSGDSCNGCGCNDGSVLCTLIACEPVVCALFVEQSDGVCSRFPFDPCISQDPDCVSSGDSCEAAGQSFPDGSDVPSGDSCNTCGCNDGSVICTEIACEPVFCALFVELSDGVCSRFPLDPCISQDPDCLSDAGSCEAAGQTFPDGSDVPSGDSCNTCSCDDGSVNCTLIACEPVFCALFVELSDGVCSRFPLDPCISQDPDCLSATEPTAP